MNRRPSRHQTLALLGGLYVSQFLGVGFFYTGLVVILRDRGASLEQLSTIQFLGLLWALKFLWAPLLDRYGSRAHGHYRGWLLLLQPAIVLGLIAMTGIDPLAEFDALVVVAAVVVLLSTTQDVAADALAVRILESGERGVGNGIQIAGGYAGNIVGGGAVLLVYDQLGWSVALVVLAACTVLPLWQVIRYREPHRASTGRRATFATVFTVFRSPGVARWSILVLPTLWTGVSAAYALTSPMLVDADWTLSEIGITTTIIAGFFAIGGALVSGALVQRYGRRRMLLTSAAAQIITVLALIPLASGESARLLTGGAICLLHFAYAAMSTTVYAINMDLCRADTAGTDFTVLASIAYLISMLAGAGALRLAGIVGYVPVLLATIALLVLALLIAARAFVDNTESLPAPRQPAAGPA